MTITYFITVVNNIKFVSISSLVPNEAPVILELNSPTSTTIHLKWSEVTQLNSVPLLGYVIIFKENITRFQPDIQKSVLPSPQETARVAQVSIKGIKKVN